MGSGTSAGQTELRQDEAVLLAHALVARLAEQVGARVLFIKGPTAVAVGARPPRPSSDVDVLVEPDAFRRLCAAFAPAGWVQRFEPSPFHHSADLAFDHSAHFIHPDWPCDLDVHFTFPGFLAPDEVVFDVLWDGRTECKVAGRSVTSPSLGGQCLVVALHALRDDKQLGTTGDVEHAAAALRSAGRAAVEDVVVLAGRTGATHSVQPLLSRLGVPLPETDVDDPKLRSWRLHQADGTRTGVLWLVELRRAPWRERPIIARRALLPQREVLVSSHLAASLSRLDVIALHLRRWCRAVRALPHAVRAARRAAQG